MPWSALPPHINEPHKWDGRDDDDHWYTKWRKSIKGWFAFGPRAKESWARFREFPMTLFAVRGYGNFRFEDDSRDFIIQLYKGRQTILFKSFKGAYLSRIQFFTDWDFQLQWPLFIGFHYVTWQGYIGFKRDADKVYWLALYFGRIWK